jgi:hypothetical protein
LIVFSNGVLNAKTQAQRRTNFEQERTERTENGKRKNSVVSVSSCSKNPTC